jgi:anti-anti-sigma regulatory factor
MGMLEAERIGDVLWITGNVMPSEEKALQQAVQEFVGQAKTPSRALDMYGVRYISSSAAKALLTLAQEAKEAGGGKLKVRSSIPVVRTLSLLGAEAYLDIEPCQKPNPKPTLGQQTGSSDSVGKLLPVAPRPTRDSNTRLQAIAPTRDSNTRLPTVGAPTVEPAARPGTRESNTQLPAVTSPTETVVERRSTVGLNAPGTSAVRAPSASSTIEQSALANAQARAGLPLATDDA